MSLNLNSILSEKWAIQIKKGIDEESEWTASDMHLHVFKIDTWNECLWVRMDQWGEYVADASGTVWIRGDRCESRTGQHFCWSCESACLSEFTCLMLIGLVHMHLHFFSRLICFFIARLWICRSEWVLKLLKGGHTICMGLITCRVDIRITLRNVIFMTMRMNPLLIHSRRGEIHVLGEKSSVPKLFNPHRWCHLTLPFCSRNWKQF